MRQLKFRVWNGTRFVTKSDTYIKTSNGSLWNYDEDYGGNGSLWSADGKIQQYTGLLDKNGVEIYEGDILEIWDGRKLPVEFGEYFTGFERRDSHNGWYLASGTAISDLALDERYAIDEYGVTVVGNVFENPELLK